MGDETVIDDKDVALPIILRHRFLRHVERILPLHRRYLRAAKHAAADGKIPRVQKKPRLIRVGRCIHRRAQVNDFSRHTFAQGIDGDHKLHALPKHAHILLRHRRVQIERAGIHDGEKLLTRGRPLAHLRVPIAHDAIDGRNQSHVFPLHFQRLHLRRRLPRRCRLRSHHRRAAAHILLRETFQRCLRRHHGPVRIIPLLPRYRPRCEKRLIPLVGLQRILIVTLRLQDPRVILRTARHRLRRRLLAPRAILRDGNNKIPSVLGKQHIARLHPVTQVHQDFGNTARILRRNIHRRPRHRLTGKHHLPAHVPLLHHQYLRRRLHRRRPLAAALPVRIEINPRHQKSKDTDPHHIFHPTLRHLSHIQSLTQRNNTYIYYTGNTSFPFDFLGEL